jgi:hypothetical protein
MQCTKILGFNDSAQTPATKTDSEICTEVEIFQVTEWAGRLCPASNSYYYVSRALASALARALVRLQTRVVWTYLNGGVYCLHTRKKAHDLTRFQYTGSSNTFCNDASVFRASHKKTF